MEIPEVQHLSFILLHFKMCFVIKSLLHGMILCWMQWPLSWTDLKKKHDHNPSLFEPVWLNTLSWMPTQRSYSNLPEQSWGTLNTVAEAFFVRLQRLLLQSRRACAGRWWGSWPVVQHQGIPSPCAAQAKGAWLKASLHLMSFANLSRGPHVSLGLLHCNAFLL